jgi:hypothetical protein
MMLLFKPMPLDIGKREKENFMRQCEGEDVTGEEEKEMIAHKRNERIPKMDIQPGQEKSEESEEFQDHARKTQLQFFSLIVF